MRYSPCSAMVVDCVESLFEKELSAGRVGLVFYDGSEIVLLSFTVASRTHTHYRSVKARWSASLISRLAQAYHQPKRHRRQR